MQSRHLLCSTALFAVVLLQAPAFAQSFSARGGGDDDSLAWMADANVGALRLENSDFQIAGDATLGLSQSFWGVEAWGSGSSYQLVSDQRESDTEKLEGAGEAWLRTGSWNDPLQLLIRASGGGANYSSTVYDKTGSGSYTDQTSWMGRGALFVGALLRPDPSFTAHLAVGGGVQFEWYDTTIAITGTSTVDDTQDLTFIGHGRLDAYWIAAPDVVSFRLRANASYFKLSRDNEFLGASGGVVSVQNNSTPFSQLEVSSRVFVDIDAASFVGFRPTVHGGLDYVRVSGEGETITTSIPEFGVGLLRPWM